MGSITFSYPTEYLLLCLGGGLIYAYLMYTRKSPWSVLVNRVLFALRALAATVLLVLLLAPVLRQIQNTTEPPQLIIAVDNSESISAMYDSLGLKALKDNISGMYRDFESMGYEAIVVTNDGRVDNISTMSYDKESTNLDQLLQDVRNDFEGRNVPEVILMSDGIVNAGMLPTYRDYPFSVSTIGLGDSTPQYDISIQELTYNKIAYQGNKFPLRVRVSQYGYNGSNISVQVIHRGNQVAVQRIEFGDSPVKEIDFQLDAERNGVQRYSVVIQPQENEFIDDNNRADAYVEVIEGKQKIVIVAASPHPDVSAMIEVLDKNPNYEVEQYILSIPEDRASFEVYNSPTDLFILHQLPSRLNGINWRERFERKSLLLMYGPQLDILRLPELFPYLQLDIYPGEFDKVSGVFNQGYSPFTFSDELQAMFNEFPPLVTPFGDYSQNGDIDVLLTQRVGSITTSKPLLMTKEEDSFKAGLLLGSGLWQWKLTDYARNKDNVLFNEFLNNLVQYLTTRADKRKFRFYPVRQEYNRGEEVVFQAEVYNELYERVYGNKVDIRLTNEEGEDQSFSFVTSEGKFQIHCRRPRGWCIPI